MTALRNRWAVALVAAAAFAGGFVAQVLVGGRAVHAQEDGARDLRVGRVIIVDDQGRDRAVLGTEGETVSLAMMDSAGRDRILLGGPQLGGPDAEPYWVMGCQDANGIGRIGWGVRDDGQASGGHITDGEGVLRIGVGADTAAGTGITLNDENGRQRLGMGVGPGGGGDFVAKDGMGNDVWRALAPVGPPALP